MINTQNYLIDATNRNQSTTELVIKKDLNILNRISAFAVAIITKIASLFSNRIDPKVAAEAWAQCYHGNRFVLKSINPAAEPNQTAIGIYNPRVDPTSLILTLNRAIVSLEYERALARSTRAYVGRADISLAIARSTSLTPEAVNRIMCLLYLQTRQTTRGVSFASMGTSQQLMLENG